MRIASLGFGHEANTFSAVPADLETWREWGILEGPRIAAEYADAQATMSGFLELGRVEPGVEVVPLVFARMTPRGPITSDALEALITRMLELLRDQGPWDGVLLAQHGAAVAEGTLDVDGEVARQVRATIGPDVPIGMTLDMHANISQQVVEHCDVVTVYQTNPHVDPRPRALEAGRLIVGQVRGEHRPRMALEAPPMTINILRQGTDDSPMRELLDLAATHRARPGVLSVSVVEGYPYADVPAMGMSFLAVTDDDEELAHDVARTLALAAWDRREHFDATAMSTEEALRHADRVAGRSAGPIVLLDTGDNVGGGSPGDSTHLLAAAQRLGVRGVFVSLCDPEAVAACVAAGVGATVALAVGAKTDALHGRPVPVRGRVRLLHDGRWEDAGPTHGGAMYFNSGTSALLATDDGHDVLLTSRPNGNTSREQLRAVGLNPHAQRIIIAKGVNSPRATYEPIAAELVYVGTPGVTSADLSTFTYHRRRRPMFPFEPDAIY
jgi:microcystin degradation protein MlrC